MKQYIPKPFLQFFALLLCAAMLVPMIPAPVSAAQTAEQSVAVSQAEIDKILDYYSGGTVSGTMEYDCGNGLTGGGEKSYLTMVTDTTADKFVAFQTKLKNAGYEVQRERTVASNSTAPNSFGSYLSPDGNYRVYTYHFPDYGETRIIVDTEERTVNGFTYEPQSGVNVEPKLVLWGLPMSVNGYGYDERVSENHFDQRNCGALVVIRMPDNSLFIHDGGDVQQWNDEACDEFVDFCRELTGTPAGQKMVVNTWFLSHAHVDHYQGFYRFINKKHDEFDIKNIMYNIDVERKGGSQDISGVMGLLKGFYPAVQYYKPHTGEIFDIAGVTFDVIYAVEDRYLPNSNGALITDTGNVGGTYRANMYKDTGKSDFNDTCAVLKVTFANNVSSILYADMNLAETVLLTVYPDGVLKTDIMMVPHHGFNTHKELVNKAASKVYLYTQRKSAVYGPDNDVTTLDMYGTYRESLRDKFKAMFPGMYVPAGTENVNYDIFWAGTETVTIDINELGSVLGYTANSKAASTYYTTQPAMDFEYTGWGILDLSSDPVDTSDVLISASNPVTEAAVDVKNVNHRFDPVGTGELKENERYAIMHVQSGNIMSYDAVAVTPGRPNQATSFKLVTEIPENSDTMDVYYVNDKGQAYIDHSKRAKAMWILHQDDTATGSVLAVSTNYSNNNALFGGTGYGHVYLNKGNATEWDADGNQTEGRNGVYWTAVYGQDNNDPATQYRYLDPGYADEAWMKTSEPVHSATDPSRKRYIIEDLGDGTFLVYWRSNSGKSVNFLTCDSNGNWGVKMYTSDDDNSDSYPSVPSADSQELNSLKLKFCFYNKFTSFKSIQFDGSKIFYVTEDAAHDQVLSYIQDHIALTDVDRNNMGVPCSGTTPKIGYYYLKFDANYPSSGIDQYNVTVLYRNDDNTDTEITTLTVNTLERKLNFKGKTTYAYDVTANVTKDTVCNQIVEGITVTNVLGNGLKDYSTGTVSYSAVPTAGSYWLEFDSEFDSSANHDYRVKVNYRNNDGSDVLVKALDVSILSFTEPESKEGLVMVNSTLGTVVKDEKGDDVTITVNGVATKVTVGMLTKNGLPVDTSKVGTYDGLTLTYGGQVICENFTLEVTQGDKVLDYPDKGEPGYVGVDKDGVTKEEDFNGVADIQLSATGIPAERGVDMIVVMDLSGSMLYKVDAHKYATDYADTRMYAMEQSLKEMIKTLQASKVDVRIAMSDFGDLDHFQIKGSVVDETIAGKSLFDVNFNNGKLAGYGEFANHLNYVMAKNGFDGDKNEVYDNPFGTYTMKFDYADPTYTDVIIPTVYTGSKVVDAGAFVPVDDLYNGTNFTTTMDSIIAKMDENVNIGYGTNYDVGLEYAYYLGHAIQQDNIAKGIDRDIICVFMSDGAPMQYNYFSGTSHGPGWPAWIVGGIDNLEVANYSESNKPAGLQTIESELLALLKAGTLQRPEHERDASLNGKRYETAADAVAEKQSGRFGEQAQGYFLYRDYVENSADQTFYDHMARQSYDLDWDYLCEIARANGIENFDLKYYRNDLICTELLELFTDKSTCVGYERQKNADGSYSAYAVYRSKLINPSLTEPQYYKACSSSETDFFAAMRAIGVECSWDLFAKIAWKNRKSLSVSDGSTLSDTNNGLTQLMKLLRTVSEGYSHKTLSPYSYFYNAEGRNWWAEAIKGDTDQLYPVINKYAKQDCETQPYTYYGDVRDNYNNQKYIAGYRGLGIDMYTVSFSVADDNYITAADAEHVLQKISSNSGTTGSYFFSAGSQEALTGALKSIVSNMSSCATGAYFTDTMGDDYDLYTGQIEDLDDVPTIKVMEYALDADGKRGELINTRETITFNQTVKQYSINDNGELVTNMVTLKAKSDLVYTTITHNDIVYTNYTEIWNDTTNLIMGKKVIYNANKTGSVDLYLDNTNRKFALQAETFFWVVGKLGETEMVLEYQVYLTGSHDDEKELAFARQYYDTNKQATLKYVNYLGNACWLPTKTPKYPWGSGATEDVIVVDFGVPVEIDVLTNDTLFSGATLVGINKDYEPTAAVDSLDDLEDEDGNAVQFSNSVPGEFGTIVRSGNKLTYTLGTVKGMQFKDVEEFTYALSHTDGMYYFGKIKIIPATTIYYEEDFVTFQSYNRADGSVSNTSVWTDDSDSNGQADIKQGQDRPGEDVDDALGSLDMDNVYGYDGSYTEFSARSQGQAKKASVDANRYGTATFSFYGTGFDVISLSNRTTGTIVVSVYDYTAYQNYLDSLKGTNPISKPESEKDVIVDTYYGYKYEGGKWVVDSTESDTLFQVPVIKVSDLPYGGYTAVITISYNDFFYHGQYKDEDGKEIKKYDFYLDAIRIYDPANDGEGKDVIEDAYIADDEGWPEYFELRNLLINKNDFDSINNSTADSVPGIIFIDGFSALQNSNGNHTNIEGTGNLSDKGAAITDYANFGPNNELYLAAGQAVAFQLSVPGTATAKVASIQLAIKSVVGSAFVKVYHADDENAANVVAPSATVDSFGGRQVSTATDLYYDITSLNNKTVVIVNTGENAGILSITNIKVTYTAEHTNNINSGFFTTSSLAAKTALRSVNKLFAGEGEEDPGEVVNGTIDIAGASLSFEDEILTNLYFTVTDIEATEMGLLTWSSEPAEGTIDNAENVFVGAMYDAQKDRYMVQTSGIAAKKLGDDIYMRVYAKTAEGIVYSDVVTYSPKQYAMSRLEKSSNADMKALCVAMLNYGAAAQEYFGYKTDDLMNAGLTVEQQALVSAYSTDLFGGAVPADVNKAAAFAKTATGFSSRSASVSFEGAFAINYYFAPNATVDGDITFYYWTAEAYANAEVLTAENASGTAAMTANENGAYWAAVSGIAAKNLDETYYVAAVYTDAEGNTYCTGVIAYSLSKYCMKNAVEGNAMKLLAEATAVYGYHANAYFNG